MLLVRLGVARPTASFPLLPASSEFGSEELFNAEPLQPYSSSGGAGGVDSEHVMSISESSNPAHSSQMDSESHPIQIVSGESGGSRRADSFSAGHDEGDGENDNDGEDGMMDDHDVNDNDMDTGDDRDEHQGAGAADHQPHAHEGGEQGESDIELDLLAESESDSDDNQSNINDASSVAQRSIQTHATAGSDTGGGVANLALFSEDDSDDSTQQEDEDDDEDESEGNESDDRDTVAVGGGSSSANAGAGGTSAGGGGSAGAGNSSSANVVDEFVIGEEQIFERRSNQAGGGSSSSQRNNLAPVSMQWAIRSRDPTSSTGVRSSAGTSGLVFIDHTSGTMRRSAATTAVAAAAAAAANSQESVTMATTASGLARAFGIIMREIGDLLKFIPGYHTAPTRLSRRLEVSQEDVNKLLAYLDRRLLPVWEWLLTVMDSTEAQLRFGASLTASSEPGGGSAQRSTSTTRPTTTTLSRTTIGADGRAVRERDEVNVARREFLSYSLSLMRAHNSEHLDSLPVIDVSSLKHVAYVFDSLIYFLRGGIGDNSASGGGEAGGEREHFENLIVHDPDEPDDMSYATAQSGLSNVLDVPDYDEEVSQTTAKNLAAGRKHSFFQRSDSTLCLGCPPPDPFQVMNFFSITYMYFHFTNDENMPPARYLTVMRDTNS